MIDDATRAYIERLVDDAPPIPAAAVAIFARTWIAVGSTETDAAVAVDDAA